MNFSQQLTEVINTLSEKFGIAIDWTEANVTPYLTDLASKIIAYELWTSVFIGALMLILIIVGATLIGLSFKKGWETDISVVYFFCGLFPLMFAMPFFLAQAFDIITALTLPEKTILDFIQLYMK